jgi:hypothetical protein
VDIAEDRMTFSQIVSSGPGCLFSSFLPIQILVPGTTTDRRLPTHAGTRTEAV